MPSIRVSDCRVSGATRNEAKPEPPTVKRNEGMEKRKMKSAMKWTTLCAAIATALQGIWHVVGSALLFNALGGGDKTTMQIQQIVYACNNVVSLIFTLSLVAFFTILFIRQK